MSRQLAEPIRVDSRLSWLLDAVDRCNNPADTTSPQPVSIAELREAIRAAGGSGTNHTVAVSMAV